MLNVMVVDDEMVIRNGISRYINSNIDGFEVICTFRDGDEAIEYLKESDVDIIISDIRMLRVSGIELAKYVCENKPYIKIIMLSGYQEFEYAQSALLYGVKAYLAKPTNFKELNDTLARVAAEIQNERGTFDSFIDRTKEMFAMIVQQKCDEGLELLESIFKEKSSMDAVRLSKYLYEFFEIITDRIYVNLNINLKAQGIDAEELLRNTARENLHDTSRKILKSIFKLTRTGEETEDYILKKAKEYIDENFSKEISLNDVADCVYLNAAYLSRIFKIGTGQTFTKYLMNKRMKYAAKLLINNVRVEEVSKTCGYNNSGYFSKIFKEYYKCTPKEYARKNGGYADEY